MRGQRWFAIGCASRRFMAWLLAVRVPARASRSSRPSPAWPVRSTATATVVAADGTRQVAPARTVTWVDRHPLFSKPRDYWDTSGDNKIVKAAAATFVGVPVGMYGEVKQIIVGAPQEPRY